MVFYDEYYDTLLHDEEDDNTNEPRPTQGGGTAVWSEEDRTYVFVTVPEWTDQYNPGDPIPDEWSVL